MVPKVSILVPHFQTPHLTLLCLRLLRLQTRGCDYETVVIDNGSTDGSGEMLRKIRWIRLLRREIGPGEWPSQSHGLALNLGVENSTAPFIVTIHTDTMIRRGDWLEFLIRSMHSGGGDYGIIGSWKLESTSRIRQVGKWFEDVVRQIKGKSVVAPRYARTHCAMYRREALMTRPEMFVPTEGHSAGEELFFAALDAGYACRFIPAAELSRYVLHLNHATMALNQHFGAKDKYMPRTRARAIRRIQQFFDSIRADEILANHSLDC